MSKDAKTLIQNVLFIGLLVIGYLLRTTLTNYIDPLIYLFGGFLLAYTLSLVITSPIPVKKTKRKTTKKKTTNKAATKKTTNKKATNNAPKKNHNQLRGKREVMTLPFEKLSWREFERLCYYYYEAKGQTPQVTNEGKDGGIDLIIWSKEDQAWEAVQIKKYAKHRQINVTHIRELNTAKTNHKCSLARFITTSDFTTDAMREADGKHIETNSGFWVENTLLKWRDQEAKRLKYIK